MQSDARSDPLDEVLRRLSNVQKKGNKHRACCPVHKGTTRSLSIRRSERDGQVLIHCFAGCNAPDILDAIGLTFRDLADKAPEEPVRFNRDPQPGDVRAFIERETRNAATLRRCDNAFDLAVIRSADINVARRRANVYFSLRLKPVARQAWEGYAPHDCDSLWPLLFDRAYQEATWDFPDANVYELRIVASERAAGWLRAETHS